MQTTSSNASAVCGAEQGASSIDATSVASSRGGAGATQVASTQPGAGLTHAAIDQNADATSVASAQDGADATQAANTQPGAGATRFAAGRAVDATRVVTGQAVGAARTVTTASNNATGASASDATQLIGNAAPTQVVSAAAPTQVVGGTPAVDATQAADVSQTAPAQGGLFDDLSVSQLIAGAAAAATSVALASKLGFAGSIIGAAVSSVVTVVASQVYRHFLITGTEKIKSAAPLMHTDESLEPQAASVEELDATRQAPFSAAVPQTRVAPPELREKSAAERAATQKRVLLFAVIAAVAAVAICSAVILMSTAGQGLGERPQSILAPATESEQAAESEGTVADETVSGEQDEPAELGTPVEAPSNGSDSESGNEGSGAENTGSEPADNDGAGSSSVNGSGTGSDGAGSTTDTNTNDSGTTDSNTNSNTNGGGTTESPAPAKGTGAAQ